MQTIQHKLWHHATVYDRRCAKRKGYNIYALGLIFERLANVPHTPEGIAAGFCGPLQRELLKAFVA